MLQTRSHEPSHADHDHETVTMFHRHRRSAAPSERYTPPTCARIAFPNGHQYWPSKDTIRAQIEGIYARLPLDKVLCSANYAVA